MSVVMSMNWPGVTKEQYEQVRGSVRWDQDVPDGAKLHVAAFDDEGAHITDVWESEEAFGRFQQERLGPGVQEAGLPGEPQVSFYPLHGVFAPALGQNEQTGDI
jgi:hypothetical protein